jgi:hypothetical protein
MAKIETKIITVKFSKLIKDKDNSDFDLNSELAKTLEEVAQEMCDSSIIVEAEVLENE